MKANKAAGEAANLAGTALGQPEGLAASQAHREKTFDELELPDQVQRLRREVIILRELLGSQQQLVERLMVHQHGQNGEMLVAMGRSGFASGGLAGRLDTLR